MAGGSNNIPERLIGFRVYGENNDLLGIANVDLPELAYMTDTVSGAGVAGEVESPVLGHFSSFTVTLHWRTIEGDISTLGAAGVHHLEIRGSQQRNDAGRGTLSSYPVKLVVRGMPKTVSLGSFETGSTTDSSIEFEVTYLKLSIDGKDAVEIDKYNYITSFGGTDLLASVKSDLGIA